MYEAPVAKTLELSNEGIICQSGGMQDYSNQEQQNW